jgi:putative ATP-binding cassette transporter
MKLIELFKRESTSSPYALIFMTALAGMSNVAVLAILNIAALQVSKNTYSLKYFILFLTTIAIYITAQRYIMHTSAREVENVLHKIRFRLADMIRRCDLAEMERIGRPEIYSCITKETALISQTASVIIVGIQSGILIFFASIYIAYLSVTAFVISTIFVLAAVSIHFRKRKELNRTLHQVTISDNMLLDSMSDMLDGFKEVKLNNKRSNDLFRTIEQISRSTADLKIKSQGEMSDHFVFSQSTFLMLLATIVFVVPRLSSIYSEVVVQLTTSMLFLIGPISSLVGMIPVVALANTAAENIYALESALSQHVRQPTAAWKGMADFGEIRFENVIFNYTDPSGNASFSVGSIDFTLRAHEVVFLIGGNGSGKSTFLKLLTALYFPASGEILIDNVVLNQDNREEYRNLFSAIFSDYHLFKRLYGLESIDSRRITELLREMEIESKTKLIDEQFETLDLSSGQKKRLALIISLLEDKPIYVFDEWAADQDPGFRYRFYHEILAELKKRGKTIVVVTHDDRYFNVGVADRVVKMEEGRLMDFIPS